MGDKVTTDNGGQRCVPTLGAVLAQDWVSPCGVTYNALDTTRPSVHRDTLFETSQLSLDDDLLSSPTLVTSEQCEIWIRRNNCINSLLAVYQPVLKNYNFRNLIPLKSSQERSGLCNC